MRSLVPSKRRLAAVLSAIAALAAPAPSPAIECSEFDLHPRPHTTAGGSSLGTTRVEIIEFDSSGQCAQWHVRSCHVMANPAGSPMSESVELGWNSSVPIVAATPGIGQGQSPAPCAVDANQRGQVGVDNLDPDQMSAECCFLAPVSTGGCCSADAGCDCVSPGVLEADAVEISVFVRPSEIEGGSKSCGLLGPELLLPVVLLTGSRRRRASARHVR